MYDDSWSKEVRTVIEETVKLVSQFLTAQWFGGGVKNLFAFPIARMSKMFVHHGIVLLSNSVDVLSLGDHSTQVVVMFQLRMEG